MSLEIVKKYFEDCGLGERVMVLEQSSATVELAAEAIGCEPARIAKTMSFLVEDRPVLVVTAGDARVDNKKFKEYFHAKAKMIPFEEVEGYVGHAPGGVCPFGVKENVETYLDCSLKRFETVYPAAGSSNSAVKLNLQELEEYSGARDWVDVCRDFKEE